ncbi:MAG: type II toxin-antitoxin system VapC family toxin [Actinomycetota bacterium]
MKLIDTSVAVDHLRGHPPATDLLHALLDEGEATVSSELVRFELLAGTRPAEADAVEAFFATLAWVPVTEAVAREGGALARRYRGSHEGIDDVDYLIAATARILEAELTTNVRHFPMFARLRPPY